MKKGEENEEHFKLSLNEIIKGNLKKILKRWNIKTIKNIKNLYGSRKKVIELYNGYAKIISETKYKTRYGEELKILTPK